MSFYHGSSSSWIRCRLRLQNDQRPCDQAPPLTLFHRGLSSWISSRLRPRNNQRPRDQRRHRARVRSFVTTSRPVRTRRSVRLEHGRRNRRNHHRHRNRPSPDPWSSANRTPRSAGEPGPGPPPRRSRDRSGRSPADGVTVTAANSHRCRATPPRERPAWWSPKRPTRAQAPECRPRPRNARTWHPRRLHFRSPAQSRTCTTGAITGSPIAGSQNRPGLPRPDRGTGRDGGGAIAVATTWCVVALIHGHPVRAG